MGLTEMYSGFKKIKTTIKKVLLLSFFCGLWIAPSYADEYLLVMSKDDFLCQGIRLMYNNDLRKHGKIMFETHEEYNWLKWDEDVITYGREGRKRGDEFQTSKLAIFDVNNDGSDEAIIFSENYLSGIFRDFLGVYPLSVSNYKNKIHLAEVAKIELSYIFGGNNYELKSLPPKREKKLHGGILKFFINIGSFMYIRPLKANETFYVSLFGSEGQGNANITLDKTNISVISKYGVDNKLEDICYFIKAYSLDKGE